MPQNPTDPDSFDASWIRDTIGNSVPPSGYTWESIRGPLSTAVNIPKSKKASQSKGKSSRSYRSWGHARAADGLTEEACLVQWMTIPGNWRDWKDARRKDWKEKMVTRLNEHFRNAGFEPRDKDSFTNKFKLIEKSFKNALRWVNSSGSGVYSQTFEEGDTRSPYQRELDKICLYYEQLFAVLKDRAELIPAKVWSTVEEEGSRQSEEVLRGLLGLGPIGSEDPAEQSHEHGDGSSNDDAHSAAIREPSARPSHDGHSKNLKRRRGSSDDEQLTQYLGEQARTAQQRLRLKAKKWKAERLKLRAETVAAYMRAGMTKEEAIATYKESKEEGSSSEGQISGKP